MDENKTKSSFEITAAPSNGNEPEGDSAVEYDVDANFEEVILNDENEEEGEEGPEETGVQTNNCQKPFKLDITKIFKIQG